MTVAAFEPSSDEFVISLPKTMSASDVMPSLVKLGTVEQVPSYPDLLVLHAPKRAANPKTLWKKIQQILGESGASAYPALHDADANVQLPLGTIGVHFNEPPTKEALQLLGKKYGLKLHSQSKHAPSQYTFTAADPGAQYLPDVIEQLQNTLDARAVWPETLSQFKRGV